MNTVIVTDQPEEWLEIPGAHVITARRYLAEAESGGPEASVRLLNFCRTVRYQGRGYYVSLVAEARGQRPLPDVKTVEDLKSKEYLRELAGELDPLMRETLRHDESDRFELDVYLGRDPAERHQALAEKLFARVRAPLLRALFRRIQGGWNLEAVQAIGVRDIPSQHRAVVVQAVQAFEAQSGTRPRRSGKPRLAILFDSKLAHQPSNDEARERFLRIAQCGGRQRRFNYIRRVHYHDRYRCGSDAAATVQSLGQRIEQYSAHEFERKACTSTVPLKGPKQARELLCRPLR